MSVRVSEQRGVRSDRHPSAVHRRRGFRPAPGMTAAIAFTVPVLLVYGLFSWWPIIKGLVLSVQKTDLVHQPSFVGWQNFTYVLTDPLLPTAVINTVWFTVLALLIGFPIPILFAVYVVELRPKMRRVFSVLIYLPVIIPPVVSVLLWRFFYRADGSGLFNNILHLFGLGPWPWLDSKVMVIPSMVLESTWASAGGTAIIYLAALMGVQHELYEAACLDGANIWQRAWHITLPQIRGMVLMMLIMQVIATMQVFTEPFLFTGGGPDNASLTLMMLIYNYAFSYNDFGGATALSVLLALVLGILAAIYFAVTKRLR